LEVLHFNLRNENVLPVLDVVVVVVELACVVEALVLATIFSRRRRKKKRERERDVKKRKRERNITLLLWKRAKYIRKGRVTHMIGVCNWALLILYLHFIRYAF